MRTGLLLLLAILLTACRSSRETTTTVRSESAANRSAIEKNGHSDGNIETTALAERLVKKVNDNRLKKETVIADTKVTLSGFSGKNLSVSGKLRMKRNDCVQLSLRVFGIEMGITEFTPEEVLIVDRPNKQYVRGRYDEIEFLRAAKLDFYSLQALFWNEIFIPGEKDASPSARHFTVRKEDGRLTLFPKDSETLRYGFSVTEKEGHLDQLTVTPASGVESARNSFADTPTSFLTTHTASPHRLN